MVSLLTRKVLVVQCCACLPPKKQVDNRVNASTLGGHNVNKILTWHPTVPPCTTTIGKPQGHNGSGTTLLMPPSPGGVLFLPPGLEIWCLTTWSTIYYKTCLKTTGLVVLVVYPPATGHLPCLVGDHVLVWYATWWLGGGIY